MPDDGNNDPSGEVSQGNGDMPRTRVGLSQIKESVEFSYMYLAESKSPIAFMCSVSNSARSPEKEPGSW